MNSTAPAGTAEIRIAPLTFGAAADAYLRRVEQNLESAATYAGVVGRFRRDWGAVALADITPGMVEAWQYARLAERTRVGGRPVSKSGVNRELAVLRAMLSWAQRNDLVVANPVARVPMFKVRNRRRVVLTEQQTAGLMAACTGRRQHLRAIVMMAVCTGMRRGEILGVRWHDLDLDRRVLTVVRAKSGEPRRIPIMPSLADDLRRRRGGAPGDALVFRHRDGRPYRSVASSWAAACREAGVPGVHLHDLRHTFASHWLEKGGDLAGLQDVLGHATPAMTLWYSHAFGGSKQATMDRIDAGRAV